MRESRSSGSVEGVAGNGQFLLRRAWGSTAWMTPLEHAEDVESQERCVSVFRDLLDRAPVELRPQFKSFLSYAIRHQQVVSRFGRFPHRNAVLGRPSTSEELSYLESGGDIFDGAKGAA